MVATGYPPDVGGIETVVGGLAPALARGGNDVRVLANGSPRSTTLEEPSLTVERFPNWLRSRRYSIAPGLWRGAKELDPDVDVLNGHSFHAVAAIGAALTTKSPFVFTPHYHGAGHTTVARCAHIPYDHLARGLFRRSAAVVCVSSAEADLLGHDYPEVQSKIKIVPNGIDVDSIGSAAPFAIDRRVILVAGRLERYKNVDQTVSALPFLPADTLLVVVGRGPEQARLQILAEALGVEDRVRLLGAVDAGTLRRWQRTATTTVSLSQREAFGLVMLEAVAAGGNAVVSNIPAHKETARLVGGCDIYFATGELRPEQLAEVILGALESPTTKIDPVRSLELSWNAVATKLLDVFRTAVRG